MRADRLLQNLGTPFDLSFYFPGTRKNQIRVVPGVIADHVAGCGHLLGDFGTFGHITADEKEGSVDLMAGEDLQKARSPGIVGTVIEGKSE